MRVHGVIVMAVFALAATALDAMPARSAVPSLDLSLTPREQSARLRLLARQARPETARRLFPFTVAERNFFHFQRGNRRHHWRPMPYGRALQAEHIGKQVRAKFNAERRWTKLLGPRTRGVRQGPDSVYWDRQMSFIRVLEAKRGNSHQPGRSYDSWRDTIRFVSEAAERVYQSPITTELAKIPMARLQSFMHTNIVMGRVGQSTAFGVSSFGTFMRRPMTRLPVRSVVPGLKVLVMGTRLVGYAAGGIIGGIVGFPAVGMGGPIGAQIGGAIGRVAAEYAASHLWEWYYYRDFDDRQLQIVNATVDKFYGLDSVSDTDPH